MAPPSDGPELVELHDRAQIEAWQNYALSGVGELISGMHLCHALLVLAESGMLERLRDHPDADRAVLVEGLDPRTATGMLRYLTVKGVVEEWNGSFRLTPRGELLTDEVALARIGFYVEAYGPVTRRATDLVTGNATYGVDVTRAGGPLSRHSGRVATVSYVGPVRECLADRDASHLVDLGCGDGSLLIALCDSMPQLRGTGIDIVGEAIDRARRNAADRGFAERVNFEVADAFAPKTWPAGCLDADVICGIGVLHELFRDGDDAVIAVLDTLAQALDDDRVLLIGEPELRYDDRENDSDFFLVHVLTAQGIPRDRAGWLDVVARSELECSRIITNAVAGPRTCFYELRRRVR